MSKSLPFLIYIHCKMPFTDLLRSCREWNSIWLHAMMFTFPSRVVNTTSAIVVLITDQQEKRIMGCWRGLKKFLKHPWFSGSLELESQTEHKQLFPQLPDASADAWLGHCCHVEPQTKANTPLKESESQHFINKRKLANCAGSRL